MMTSASTPATPQPYSDSPDYRLEVHFGHILDTHMSALNQAMTSVGKLEAELGQLGVFRKELERANQEGGFARLIQNEDWDGMNLVAGAKAFYDQLDPIKKPLLHPMFKKIDHAIREAREKGGAEEMCDLVSAKIAPIVGEIRKG